MSVNSELIAAVQLFQRAARLHDESVAAHWLNRYHELMDQAEAEGMDVTQINLPLVWPQEAEQPVMWQRLPCEWNLGTMSPQFCEWLATYAPKFRGRT